MKRKPSPDFVRGLEAARRIAERDCRDWRRRANEQRSQTLQRRFRAMSDACAYVALDIRIRVNKEKRKGKQ